MVEPSVVSKVDQSVASLVDLMVEPSVVSKVDQSVEHLVGKKVALMVALLEIVSNLQLLHHQVLLKALMLVGW